jgi:Glyoxalase-like domain
LIDHLVYATTDLEASVDYLGERLGVAPAAGGQHVGRGTRNYLLGLAGGSYLELIGPDPEQPDFSGVRAMGLDTLGPPQLVGWAMRVTDIEGAIDAARERAYDPGPVRRMSRRQPNGRLLSWKLTDMPGDTVPSLLPFLIDWGDSPHPTETAPEGARLEDFRLESPDPERIRAALESLSLQIPVQRGERPRLIATIAGLAGTLVLE